MTGDAPVPGDGAEVACDVGAYCRQVEDYLTRANGGHLVRIIGPGFEMVRQWAAEGIPLSVVYHAIDAKVERHEAGRATRPLRIEFCEADVRTTFARWCRAVGVPVRRETPDEPNEDDADAGQAAQKEPRHPSLSKHLDRAVERLGRAAGRLDLPEALRDAVPGWIEALTSLHAAAKGARGPARGELAAQLAPLDRVIGDVARDAAPANLRHEVRREAEQDLAPFRGRLTGDAWQHALDATIDRLLRDRLGLPTLEA